MKAAGVTGPVSRTGISGESCDLVNMGEREHLRGKAGSTGFGLECADLGCLRSTRWGWLAATWHRSLQVREGVQAEDTGPRGAYLYVVARTATCWPGRADGVNSALGQHRARENPAGRS